MSTRSLHDSTKGRRWKLPTIVGVTAGLIGIGIGAAGQPEPEVVTKEVEVIKEVPAEPEVITEEVEVTVEVVPESCTLALEAGERSIDLLASGLDYSADALLAASTLDVAGIDAATANIEAITPDLEAAGFDWGFWSESCKEATR